MALRFTCLLACFRAGAQPDTAGGRRSQGRISSLCGLHTTEFHSTLFDTDLCQMAKLGRCAAYKTVARPSSCWEPRQLMVMCAWAAVLLRDAVPARPEAGAGRHGRQARRARAADEGHWQRGTGRRRQARRRGAQPPPRFGEGAEWGERCCLPRPLPNGRLGHDIWPFSIDTSSTHTLCAAHVSVARVLGSVM